MGRQHPYVRLLEQFVYLAVVLDAFSRRVIGWELAAHLQASLALVALDMALLIREVVPGGLVHHSDRGVQYACGAHVGRLDGAGIQPSMSRVGCPWDNAMAESFMRTLKREEVDGRAYRNLADARASIGQRLHSALDYLSPLVFEARLSAGSPQMPPGTELRPHPCCPVAWWTTQARCPQSHRANNNNNKPA